MIVIRNMARQHREFQSQLDDAEKLRLYAHSVVSKHQTLEASLAKVRSRSKHWDFEAKAGREKIARMEKEMDEAKQETKVAHLVANAISDTRVRVEEDQLGSKKP